MAVTDPPLPQVYPYLTSSGAVYGRENITSVVRFVRGDDYVFDVTVYDYTGAVIDITDYTFELTCRYSYDGSAAFSCSSDSDGIALTTPASGLITVTIAASKTASLADGELFKLPFDIEMTDDSGLVTTIVYGIFVIQPDVTYT